MSQHNPLTIEIATEIPAPTPTETIAACVFEDEPHATLAPGEMRGPEGWREMCEQLMHRGEFEGKAGTSLLVRAAVGGDATGADGRAERRLLLVGLGERREFDLAAMSRAAASAVRRAREARAAHLHFLMPEESAEGGAHPIVEMARAITEGALHGAYENDFYQQREDDARAHALERFSIIVTGEWSGDLESAKSAVERGRIVGDSANWARRLADEPGATLPPREFARRAAEMAAEFGLVVESLGADEVRERGMGGLAGVGQGSDEEPALIVVRYEPDEPPDDGELWAFVGKGITFDTGGISIKHGLDMYEMKSDMAGGAAVLGALRAIAQLKPRRRIVGIVPAAENMPSGRSIKPGDVVRTLAGYTIEVVDTDAEGRLVLVDGIAYARNLGAARIVDLATLTGSIIIALGTHRAGLFSNDDAWAERVLGAAQRAGEPVWRMPVDDDYKKRIESPIADYKNYGGRPDAIAAALLLSKFAADTPWVHLDIAGTGWLDDPQPHAVKGSTGTGVRTLVELACE